MQQMYQGVKGQGEAQAAPGDAGRSFTTRGQVRQ